MKNLFGLVLLSLITTSCVSLNGDLQVTEAMNLKKKGGFLNLGRKNITIEPNAYNARLTVLGKNNFSLILEKGDERISIPLKSKEDLKVPTFDGSFRISHSAIDQPYDVQGTIRTDINHSPTEERIESCTWDTKETKCRIECRDVVTKDDKGVERTERKCEKVCEDFVITHHGRKEVIFHYTTTHRDLDLTFLKENSDDSVAQFRGQDTESVKVIEREGICN